jgi:hypothetical protein
MAVGLVAATALTVEQPRWCSGGERSVCVCAFCVQ